MTKLTIGDSPAYGFLDVDDALESTILLVSEQNCYEPVNRSTGPRIEKDKENQCNPQSYVRYSYQSRKPLQTLPLRQCEASLWDSLRSRDRRIGTSTGLSTSLKEELPETLVAALTAWLKAPLANFRQLRRLTTFGDGNNPKSEIQ